MFFASSELMTETTSDPIEMPAAEVPVSPGEAPAIRDTQYAPLANWQSYLVDAFLIVLILIGLYFRFSWVNWNQDTDLHPDEYGLTSTITRLAIPASLGDYFNTRLSSISPYQKYDEAGLPTEPGPDNRMRWGQWPIIIIRFAAEVSGNTDYGNLRLMGRRLSALADSLALLVIFFIGARLYNRRVGLMAAAFSALAVMQIQQAHFMTADTFATMFTALAMYCAVRVAQEKPGVSDRPGVSGSWSWYALFGVASGMAVASRINLLPLIGMIFIAAVIANAERWNNEKNDASKIISEAAMRLALALVVAFLTFRVTQPMAFRAESGDTTFFTLTPNPDWRESMAVAQAESSGIGGGPPGEQWTNRPALVFPFVNMVVWGMGLPLGLMAWAGLAWAAWRTFKDKTSWQLHSLPLVWAGGMFLFMGTRWVKSIRYFLPIYPFMALFAAWALYELWTLAVRRADTTSLLPRRFSLLKIGAGLLIALVALGALTWAWGFTHIYRLDNTRIQASKWIYQNIPGPINVQLDTADGVPYTEPIAANIGEIMADNPAVIPFKVQTGGTLSGLKLGHVRNEFDPATPAILRVVLAADPTGGQPLAQTEIAIPPTADPRGGSITVPFGPAVLTPDTNYFLSLTAPQGGPLIVSGAVVANESWDEGLPLRIQGRDGFGGLYRGLTMEVRWLDDDNKRQMFLTNLEQVDYIILPSQRALWSASRLPNTYPMTMEYYRALFDGRLGFDLVAQFQSPITIGPLQISDLVGAAAWGRPPDVPRSKTEPWNFSQLAAEEAFSVYDHAPVWIFKKRADFSMDNAQAILYSIDLTQVINQGPREATAAPTLLLLPQDRLQEQRAGGTWSEMFDQNGLLNRFEPLGVIVWWITVTLLGWLAFPITFVALRGLPDRGYTLTRNVSLLLIAWAAWILASVRLMPFTRLTLWLVTLAMGVIAVAILWRRLPEIKGWVLENKRYVLFVEALALGFFIFFLLIRLGNADLWHPSYGGEKPMDFSYFNAVLKSASFPPYDPWFAGGYLNYYYFGFVIVGTVTKMLGIVPSFAYNLILPMLFAMVGVSAFGVAYSLVRGRQFTGHNSQLPMADLRSPISNLQSSDLAQDKSPISNSPISNLQPPTSNLQLPNPYLAGVLAALLFVVLGNLGQLDVIKTALTRAADDAQTVGIPVIDDWQKMAIGFRRIVVDGQPVPIGTGEWYWNATRVTPEVPIAEFPFFTFLYADLHAHMIVLTMTLLALGWIVGLINGVGEKGGWIETAALWLVGGLIFGVIQPSNLSDYQTYWLLGCVAIFYAEYRKRGTIDFQMLFDTGLRCAILIGLAILFFRPYSSWRGEGYGSVQLWDGDRTPLNAYFTIHGVFLFIIFTFLLVETRRWMQRTLLADVKDWIMPFFFALAAFFALVFVLWWAGYTVALIALPLVAWTGLLMIRGDVEPERRVTLAWIGLGLLLTLVVEAVTAVGDIGRMNTVFKFYLQVWTLFSVAGGAAAAWIWAQLPEWRPLNRDVWRAAFGLFLLGALTYTIFSTNAKVKDRMAVDAPRTLDGMAYMAYSRYADNGQEVDLKWDYDAIKWMQANVQGSPVIVEQNAVEYRWGSRYTINTGLPGVVGWNWHQRQQRVVVPDWLVTRRVDDIHNFYSTLDPGLALEFLKKYGVSYVIVGGYEKAYYPPESFMKFEQMVDAGQLTVAYQNERTVIYKVMTPSAGN
jgi:YYY domain-containing protein